MSDEEYREKWQALALKIGNIVSKSTYAEAGMAFTIVIKALDAKAREDNLPPFIDTMIAALNDINGLKVPTKGGTPGIA